MHLTKLLFVFIIASFELSATAQLISNNAYAKNDVFIDDHVAPITDLLRTEAREFIFGTATRIKFKILEEDSGLGVTYFKIADLPYIESNGGQMVPCDLADGEYDIKYYSVDKNGNQEQIRFNKIYFDKKGPVISAAFDGSPKTIKNGLPVFTERIKLLVNAADEKVKVGKLSYKINDGPLMISADPDFVDLEEAISKSEAGLVRIEVTAHDIFDNLTQEIVEFIKM